MNTKSRRQADGRSKQKQLWIGLVEVRSLRGVSEVLGKAKGAFVNILTWASDAREYRQNADLIAQELGLFVVDVQDPEPVEARRMNGTLVLDEETDDMIARAQENPRAIIYGTFHTFERDDA